MENLLESKEKENWLKAWGESSPNFNSIGEAVMLLRDGLVFCYFDPSNEKVIDFVKNIILRAKNICPVEIIYNSLL